MIAITHVKAAPGSGASAAALLRRGGAHMLQLVKKYSENCWIPGSAPSGLGSQHVEVPGGPYRLSAISCCVVVTY
jgi:hypothetical protein